KLLIVSDFDRCSHVIKTITKYVRIGNSSGHRVALFSDPLTFAPDIPTSRNATEFDYVIFVVCGTSDFPDPPHIAYLLDSVPRNKRIVVDCAAHYNDTIQIEDDLNHPKIITKAKRRLGTTGHFNHLGWEWADAFSALTQSVLQPVVSPLHS